MTDRSWLHINPIKFAGDAVAILAVMAHARKGERVDDILKRVGDLKPAQYLELLGRFPVLDGRDALVEEILGLFTPRNLYALHAIGAKMRTNCGSAWMVAISAAANPSLAR